MFKCKSHSSRYFYLLDLKPIGFFQKSPAFFTLDFNVYEIIGVNRCIVPLEKGCEYINSFFNPSLKHFKLLIVFV